MRKIVFAAAIYASAIVAILCLAGCGGQKEDPAYWAGVSKVVKEVAP